MTETDARHAEALRALAARIDRLVTDPDAIEAPPTRLARPLLARFGYGPKARTEALQRLIDDLRDQGTARSWVVGRAIDELRHNVRSVERACVVHGAAMVSHCAWLWRVHDAIVRCHAAVWGETQSQLTLSLARAVNRTLLLPPLALLSSASEDLPEPDLDALDGQLGAIDHLLAAADAESQVLARRRGLLEAGRQLLLEASAALPLDGAAVDARLRHIAGGITRLDRLQAAGLRPDVDILHQARGALARGDRDTLYAALVALDDFAHISGSAAVARRTGAALDAMLPDPQQASREDSWARSARQAFDDGVMQAICAGIDARSDKRQPDEDEATHLLPVAERLEALIARGEVGALSACVAVDGCVEVGGGLSPVRVEEIERRLELVHEPTAQLVVTPAEGLADLPVAIVRDPRSMLYDLATGRLLARRFAREETRLRSRVEMRGEIRVFVLDRSSSMRGARAQVRDSILVAELATMTRRLTSRGRVARRLLFYRYFNDRLGETVRVDSVARAMRAITEVLAVESIGGTDIEEALVYSFEQIHEARASDPDLARAQVVLITDGEAAVSAERVAAARRGLEEMPIGVSVIALGEENSALRSLVAEQRANGERAFYHYLTDETIDAIASGAIDGGRAIHLPSGTGVLPSLDTIRDDLHAAMAELATLGRARDVAAMERVDMDSAARAELGLDRTLYPESDYARTLALRKDRDALTARYAIWFPESSGGGPSTALPEVGTVERADLDAVLASLATVVEVVEITAGSELSRMADAIEILERLLLASRLPPSAYHAVLLAYPAECRVALDAVHAATAPPRDPAVLG